MKRRKLANGIMVLLILVIGAAGVLTAGFIRGWFDRDTEAATLTAVSYTHLCFGKQQLRRHGVASGRPGHSLRPPAFGNCSPASSGGLAELKKTDEDQAAADRVKALIDAIGKMCIRDRCRAAQIPPKERAPPGD